MYDKEFYKNPENILDVLRIGFLVGSLVMGCFMMFLLLGSGQSDFTITRQMILFYGVLSYSTGFGFLVFIFFLEHPNKWVGRVFFLILFAIPLGIEFL